MRLDPKSTLFCLNSVGYHLESCVVINSMFLSCAKILGDIWYAKARHQPLLVRPHHYYPRRKHNQSYFTMWLSISRTSNTKHWISIIEPESMYGTHLRWIDHIHMKTMFLLDLFTMVILMGPNCTRWASNSSPYEKGGNIRVAHLFQEGSIQKVILS